jgi:hypothetical protein
MDGFLRGGERGVVQHSERLPLEETVTRALSCLGHQGYSIIWRNCEHFARWCAVGRHESTQVRDALGSAVAVGFAGSVVAALARREGLMLLSRAIPALAPLGAGLLVAGVVSSVLGADLSPFSQRTES